MMISLLSVNQPIPVESISTLGYLGHWNQKDLMHFVVMLTQNNACTLGYIDSSKLSHHTPEEFICFTGSNIKGGSDASFHKDADSYWRNRFAPITRENSKDEDDSPVSNFRLSLHPFATEVFKHKGKEHGSLEVCRKIHP